MVGQLHVAHTRKKQLSKHVRKEERIKKRRSKVKRKAIGKKSSMSMSRKAR